MAVKLGLSLLVIFLVLQVVRPQLENPPVTAEVNVPPEVKQILEHSCYNCHSNQTQLAWFDKIVPAYWMVVNDVHKARQHVNFSEIGAQPAKQKGTLFEAVNQIQMGAMPLPSYLRVHPDAAVTADQLAVLRSYLNSLTPVAAVAATPQAAATPAHVEPALNGVEFLPDYKNWKEISGTERFDNQTVRVILGNDVAIKAIAANRINPWPDGTAFAKVAWFQQPDANGTVKAGAFAQIEFMIRDSRKYPSTKNWGFGRWLGTELKPYGKDAAFAEECVSCHAPVKDNDYVYTMPIPGQ